MSVPTPPTGYDVAKHVPHGRGDCHLTVGFDRGPDHIPRFLVMLHYQVSAEPLQWAAIARMDHNETSPRGHDVYDEGLHVDVARCSKRTVHLHVTHAPLPTNRGKVIRGCVEYLEAGTEFFLGVYEERYAPGGPPKWSDGGDSTRTFICTDTLDTDMSKGTPAETDILTLDELSELLAEATDTTAEEIERGADELAIAPPEEAEVVGYGGFGPLTES